MSSHRQVALWIDHHEARVVHVDAEGFDESRVAAPHAHIHRHPKGSTAEHNHPDDIQRFFHDVSKAVSDAEEILVVGPSTAKLQFLRYLHAHAQGVQAKVVGIESVDHPTDRQFVAYAKKYFDHAAHAR